MVNFWGWNHIFLWWNHVNPQILCLESARNQETIKALVEGRIWNRPWNQLDVVQQTDAASVFKQKEKVWDPLCTLEMKVCLFSWIHWVESCYLSRRRWCRSQPGGGRSATLFLSVTKNSKADFLFQNKTACGASWNIWNCMEISIQTFFFWECKPFFGGIHGLEFE